MRDGLFAFGLNDFQIGGDDLPLVGKMLIGGIRVNQRHVAQAPKNVFADLAFGLGNMQAFHAVDQHGLQRA